jgi:stearoyl-CoA desaturase (delta-9 desaturase)
MTVPKQLPKQLPIDWRNVILLAAVHVVAVGGLAVYLPRHGMTWAAAGIGLGLTALTILSVSAGYHRLFSHRTYEAHPVVRFLLLAFGAGAFQNSVIAWAADHRRHHARTDTHLDPYEAGRGFWHSHVGWVLRRTDTTIKPTPVRDLERDPLVMWQHRNYALVGLLTGVGLPVLLGFLLGDPWGGFLVGAAARLVVTYHATFSINSFAHILGVQPYSDKSSARDSLFTALISMGEGYHNFHHTFPADYRNGVERHHFDPTKWVLRALAAVGLIWNLRRTPRATVLRARVRMDEQRLAARELTPSLRARLQQSRNAIEEALARWSALLARHESARRELATKPRDVLRAAALELRAARRELAAAYGRWRRSLQALELALG